MNPLRRDWIGRGTLLLLGVLLAAASLEVLLRVLSPPSPFDARLALRPYVRRELHPRLRGVSPVARFTTNRWGMRGSDPPADWEGAFTVVAVGGSTTQCFYLDDAKTWPALLEQRLRAATPRAWVGNGGLDGHSSRGHLVFMETAVRAVRPDLVIVLAGINDLGYSFEQAGRDLAQFERGRFRYWLLANSRLLQVLSLRRRILFDRVTVVRDAGHGDYVPEPLAGETPLPAPLADHLPSLAAYRDNLERIIAAGRRDGVRLLLLTQPMLFDDTPRWRAVSGSLYWVRGSGLRVSAATLSRMLAEFNRTMREVCAARGVPCLDLAAQVPHREEYFYDAVHLTEAGAALVAERVADGLLSRGMVPAP